MKVEKDDKTKLFKAIALAELIAQIDEIQEQEQVKSMG